ncbi:MAG: restriction endonuclease subunit S [Bacteroidales bacterium]|nr:restriction endonuclease subunit S [Candidatus Equimonas faecalis]
MTGQQLRNSILQEAIHGRLVPNTLQPGELTARELLNDILAARQKAENEAKGKKAKKLTLSKIEEEPWELPEGWCWCRIEDIFDHSAGKSQNSSQKTIGKIYQYLTTSNVYWEGIDFTKVKEMAFTEEEYAKCSAVKGDLLVCEGGDVGRSCIWPYDYRIGLQNHIHRLRPVSDINVKFFYYVMMLYKSVGIIAGKGIGITGLSAGVLKGTPIPLPPLSIQHSIVSKIEALLPLVEAYDAAQGELRALNESLPDKLRKSVLQEAIHGRLVPNTLQPGELTASELLNDILAARQNNENETKGKKAKKLTLSKIEEEPWELPEGWCWCTLGDLADRQVGKTPERHNAAYWADGKQPWISISDMQDYGRVNATKERVSALAEKEVFAKRISKKGALIMSFKLTVGRTCILDIDAYHNEAIVTFLIPDELADLKMYLFWLLPIFTNASDSKDAVKGKTLNKESINATLIPLPPLSIQHSIVSKIEEIFKLLEK